MSIWYRIVGCAVLLAISLPGQSVQADAWDEVLFGLDYAGFQFSGQRNPLSQGLTIQTFRNFQGTRLDFGATELTLTGPAAAQVTTANRGFRSLDFAVTLGTAENPLAYIYESDVGSSAVRVDGSTVFDLSGSINQFGWYDFEFEWSSRQTSSSTGRFSDPDEQIMDFDIGPINVSGNLFADLLATMTDPLFESSGQENIFASFSGRTARENALESTVSKLRSKAAAGAKLSQREVADLVRMAAEARFHGDWVPSLDFLNQSDLAVVEASGTLVPQAVPEPSTLVLLLVPAIFCIRRRR